MKVPEHISINDVQSTPFGILNQTFPHLHFIQNSIRIEEQNRGRNGVKIGGKKKEIERERT